MKMIQHAICKDSCQRNSKRQNKGRLKYFKGYLYPAFSYKHTPPYTHNVINVTFQMFPCRPF